MTVKSALAFVTKAHSLPTFDAADWVHRWSAIGYQVIFFEGRLEFGGLNPDTDFRAELALMREVALPTEHRAAKEVAIAECLGPWKPGDPSAGWMGSAARRSPPAPELEVRHG